MNGRDEDKFLGDIWWLDCSIELEPVYQRAACEKCAVSL
jgi:hypothetical protein